MHVIYDVSHNIAKVEQHIVDGKQKTLLVHRKVSYTYINELISQEHFKRVRRVLFHLIIP